MVSKNTFVGREMRSLVTSEAVLRISMEEVEYGPPADDELIVRVEAAPVNPSDVGLLLGGVSPATLQAKDGQRESLYAAVPPELFSRLVRRVDQSLSVGLEGAGTVVATGSSVGQFLGKRVAITGPGAYADFRKIRADSCLLLPDSVSSSAGAAIFVNPMTALSIMETMRLEGHGALVHTAAASNLGQLLNKLCLAEGIGLVNIVRSPAQVELLRSQGAGHVCDSSSPGFEADLARCISMTKASLAFDAVGGGPLAGQILTAMEKAFAQSSQPYSRYGSTRHKQVYFYGGLDPSPTILSRDYGMAWGVGAWLLNTFLAKIDPSTVVQFRQRIVSEIETTFANQYRRSVPLEGLLDVATLVEVGARSTGGKILVEPHAGR